MIMHVWQHEFQEHVMLMHQETSIKYSANDKEQNMSR